MNPEDQSRDQASQWAKRDGEFRSEPACLQSSPIELCSQGSECKLPQARKIGELRDALVADGYVTLDAQAFALGLGRSTTWAILRANHKASGLSASVVSRMLGCPHLPHSVRKKLAEYVEEKVAGAYGHSDKQVQRFAAGLTTRLLKSTASPHIRQHLAGIEAFVRLHSTKE